jgi:hypothetical protein
LEEQCSEICQHFESGQFHLNIMAFQLKDFNKSMAMVTSRFVDIDTSFREDQDLNQQVKNNLAQSLQDPELQEHLFNIYETIKGYLALRYKFGEAADWYLKNEFDVHLENEINLALVRGQVQ